MAQTGDIKPESIEPLRIPESSDTVEISIINTTTNIVVPASGFVEPVLKGHEYINMPTFAFYIKHPSGKEIMFDLGGRKDWWNWAPATLNHFKANIPGCEVQKSINEILHEGAVDPKSISSIIWSHWHWDHTGDPSLFPESAELVVGPGFKEAFLPGYPANEKAVMLESDFAGRNLREVDFSSSRQIGGMEYYDFFGDGSFYLLNTPGHAVGHISALARTTPETFVFMGGDICHFGGSIRPSPYQPMPDPIPSYTRLNPSRFRMPCPCSVFTACHPDPPNARTKPYYKVSRADGSWYVNPEAAQQSINKLDAFDADERVFVCLAHDQGLQDVVDWFPTGNLNGWKKKGWKEQSHWGFLNALPIDGKPAADRLVPGLMRDGKLVRD